MDLNRLSRIMSQKEQKQDPINQSHLLDEELKCPICLEISRSPVTSNCCGSVFCLQCVKQISSHRCPKCNQQYFTYSENKFAKRLVSQYPQQCRFGCGFKTDGSEIQKHEQQCPNRIIQCKYCVYSDSYNGFIQHVISQHAQQMVQMFEQH